MAVVKIEAFRHLILSQQGKRKTKSLKTKSADRLYSVQ